jgi:hypothetical protein
VHGSLSPPFPSILFRPPLPEASVGRLPLALGRGYSSSRSSGGGGSGGGGGRRPSGQAPLAAYDPTTGPLMDDGMHLILRTIPIGNMPPPNGLKIRGDYGCLYAAAPAVPSGSAEVADGYRISEAQMRYMLTLLAEAPHTANKAVHLNLYPSCRLTLLSPIGDGYQWGLNFSYHCCLYDLELLFFF